MRTLVVLVWLILAAQAGATDYAVVVSEATRSDPEWGRVVVALDLCVEGMCYDELVKNKLVQKAKGGRPTLRQAPDDTTAALVKTLTDYRADLFIASGHATERDWQIGYRYRNGSFRCAEGQLYGLDTQGNKYPILSPNPKVYLPVGNVQILEGADLKPVITDDFVLVPNPKQRPGGKALKVVFRAERLK